MENLFTENSGMEWLIIVLIFLSFNILSFILGYYIGHTKGEHDVHMRDLKDFL